MIIGTDIINIMIAVVALSMAMTPIVIIINEKLILPRFGTKEKIDKESIPTLTFSQVVQDFTVVQKFISQNKYVSFIYLGFIIFM